MVVPIVTIASMEVLTPPSNPLTIPTTMSLPKCSESFSSFIHFSILLNAFSILLQNPSILTLSNPFDISPNSLVSIFLKFCTIFCTAGSCIKACTHFVIPSIKVLSEAAILSDIPTNIVCSLNHFPNTVT